MDIQSVLAQLLSRKSPPEVTPTVTPESGLGMAARQLQMLKNQSLSDSQMSPGRFVNNSPFQTRFQPRPSELQAQPPDWERALAALSNGIKAALNPMSPEGLPASGPAAGPRKIMEVERGGEKIKLLSGAPSKSGKTVQTTVGENTKLTLNPLTGQARLSDKKIGDLTEAQRFSLILAKRLQGVKLTAEDERILAAWESKRAAKK